MSFLKFLTILLGVLLLLAVSYYIYSFRSQLGDVAEFCSDHPDGSTMTDIQAAAERYSGELRGPFELKDRPGAEQYIFCAPLTMCDVSCRMVIDNKVVVESEYSNQ